MDPHLTPHQRKQIDGLKQTLRQILSQKGERGLRVLTPKQGLDPARYPLLHQAMIELSAERSLSSPNPEDRSSPQQQEVGNGEP